MVRRQAPGRTASDIPLLNESHLPCPVGVLRLSQGDIRRLKFVRHECDRLEAQTQSATQPLVMINGPCVGDTSLGFN
jgi:hypothetical protein